MLLVADLEQLAQEAAYGQSCVHSDVTLQVVDVRDPALMRGGIDPDLEVRRDQLRAANQFRESHSRAIS